MYSRYFPVCKWNQMYYLLVTSVGVWFISTFRVCYMIQTNFVECVGHYLNNRLHFLSLYQPNNPHWMLGEHKNFLSITSLWHTLHELRGDGWTLESPNFSLKFKKNSFSYLLTKLWNSLPAQVPLSRDANDFKLK